MVDLPLGHRLVRLLAIVSISVLIILLTAWVRSDPVENLLTDWTSFDNAGDRLIAGERVYRPISLETEPLPYLYPPYVLWLALPLAALGFWGSFLFSSALTLVANITGLVWFGRGEGESIDRSTGVIVAVASGSTVSSALIGQYSGLYVLAFAAALLAYRRNARFLVGLILASLWIKPNIAVAVPVVLLWSRSWRSCRGFVAGSVVMGLLSLPFGLDQWRGFADNARQMAELQEQGIVPVDKMVTALSSIQTLFGLETEAVTSFFIWIPIAAVLGISVLMVWTPSRLEESPLRSFGALCLFVVAANPRMYFYDGTLVAAGLYAVWLSSRTLSGKSIQRSLSVLAVIAWVGLWGSFYLPANLLVGPAAAISLVIVAISSRASAFQISPVSDIKRNEFESTISVQSTDLAA